MSTISRVIFAARRGVTASRRELSALVSLAEEFPGLPATIPEPSKARNASVSTLSNGLTVVTEDASSTTTVTITFPAAGSSDEAAGEEGAALANKCMAFKSGSGLSSTLIYRTLEDDGAIPFAYADRTHATLGFTSAPDKALRLVPLLATDCTFEKWDLRDSKSLAGVEVEEAYSSAQIVLTESIYAASFGPQSSMGKPFYASGASSEAIKSFYSRAYGLNGAILAATGISDHAAFVMGVEERLSESVVGSKIESSAPSFMGGEARVHAPSTGFANVAIAFSAPSNTVLGNVMKHCLSLGGVDSFAVPGLVGVYGGAGASEVVGVVDELCSALTASPSPDTVKSAKALAKAEALFSLEDGSKDLAGAMTASVMESGSFSVPGLVEAYDSITDEQVKSAFSTMLKSNPGMAAVGDISAVPYHATVAGRFS